MKQNYLSNCYLGRLLYFQNQECLCLNLDCKLLKNIESFQIKCQISSFHSHLLEFCFKLVHFIMLLFVFEFIQYFNFHLRFLLDQLSIIALVWIQFLFFQFIEQKDNEVLINQFFIINLKFILDLKKSFACFHKISINFINSFDQLN